MCFDFKNQLELFKFREDCLFFVKDIQSAPIGIRFHLEKAEALGVDAVYFRYIENSSIQIMPFIYIYNNFANNIADMGELCRKNWSSGTVPFTFVYSRTCVTIYNNLKMPGFDSDTQKVIPVTFDVIDLTAGINSQLKEKISNYSANLFDTGSFWNSDNVKKQLNRSEGSYELLLRCLKDFRRILIKSETTKIIKSTFDNDKQNVQIKKTTEFINKFLVLCIFIKFLEEKKDGNEGVFQEGFFESFSGCCFTDVLRNSNETINLFKFLSGKFNGRVFTLDKQEENYLNNIDISLIADFLDGCISHIYEDGEEYAYQPSFWRLYSFKDLHIEFISNIYEEFIIGGNEKKANGVVYTPPHLVQFLIDEVMSVESCPDNFQSYKILDPACGSGIFLVGAFKRLIQWWRIKNNWKKPSSQELIDIIINSIYGIDKNGEALKVAVFSLYLTVCDCLSPKKIWDDLVFEDLLKENFIEKDFFTTKIHEFDLIIGNPPFERAKEKWTDPAHRLDKKLNGDNKNRSTPPDLAMLFYEECSYRLKKNGLICLILPSSRLLYNGGAVEYRRYLFSKFCIPQIIDFTHLNRILFEGRGDISACALFGVNKKGNSEETLHIIVKRTKAAKEKIYFELDYYDFHYVSNYDAINNEYIWKANYWGGSRLTQFAEKFSKYNTFKDYIDGLDSSKWTYKEGLRGSRYDKQDFDVEQINLNEAYWLNPPNKLSQMGIDINQIYQNKEDLFVNKSKGLHFLPPHILIREVIEAKTQSIPMAIDFDNVIYFGERIVGISCPPEESEMLNQIFSKMKKNMDLYKLYLALASDDFSTGTSSAIVKKDLDSLPWGNDLNPIKMSEIEKIFMEDIFTSTLVHKREGERSSAVSRVGDNDLDEYGQWFCNILNSVYASGDDQFVSGEPTISNSLVCYPFFLGEPKKRTDKVINEKTINNLINTEYESLIIKRLIKYYSRKMVILVKANEKRYWLRSIAIRDADDTVNDFVQQGF